LTAGPNGALQLDGEGVIVDWLVKMRRLPADRMLDLAIVQGRIDKAAVHRAASYLARFYVDRSPVRISQSAFVQRFAEEVQGHERELARPAFGMPKGLVRSITSAHARFLEDRSQLLHERVRRKRVVEGHGDLRPEHIYIGDPPAVIDCLEFNRAFRIVDPAEELSFLSMECDYLGAPEVGEPFWEAYEQATGDRAPDAVVQFYKSHRACLRAKLSLWHLADSGSGEITRWRSRALRYLRLAAGAAARLARCTQSAGG
jgi:aminoglycoside phosphotransferase family enzyme